MGIPADVAGEIRLEKDADVFGYLTGNDPADAAIEKSRLGSVARIADRCIMIRADLAIGIAELVVPQLAVAIMPQAFIPPRAGGELRHRGAL
jgi:hypothetical protein